ncbi:MAG: hypothetical protein K1V86_07970 [Duncaniella sp.]
MKRIAGPTGLTALLLLTAACGGGGSDEVVPRPVAWPRIEMPDSSYADVHARGLRLRVNKSADVDVSPAESGTWIDVGYNVIGSPRLYLTLTECGDGETGAVLANRRERVMLNLGGQRCEVLEFATPAGWECALVVARGSMTTPVQLLAHDRDRVLSGALTLSLPDSLAADPAMIAPVVDAVERDMTVLLKGLDDE